VTPRRRHPHTRHAAEYRLRTTAQRLDRAHAERDGAILDAVEFGLPVREVGRLVGMTHAGVIKLVRRWEDATRS
jgi:hypothetical protein